MPELLLELFCEEIPARMQARAAEHLGAILSTEMESTGLLPTDIRTFSGPRRIVVAATIAAEVAATIEERRGPRSDAPANARAAFISANTPAPVSVTSDFGSAGLADLEASGEFDFTARFGSSQTIVFRYETAPKGIFLFVRKTRPARASRDVLPNILSGLIRAFPWPKSMRWGGSSGMTWVRPLKRILCVLDGVVVPFDLRAGDDDGHGLVSGHKTEGHRIMAPGAFAVRGLADYQQGLHERRVVLDAAERARLIRDGIAALCATEGLAVVPDEGLVTEVAGLVEWPVPLLGRIDDAFMDLPPEVMRTTMRVNQRYFALRRADGSAAPRFALVANIAAPDGGAAIVAGNERVLRARLSDARFFWDLDRKQSLESFLPKLDTVVFHAKLGTQGQRVARLERLARIIAAKVGADPGDAARAARLAKADLATGMVGEFPELQGVMGRYYALAQGEKPAVAEAIATHYRPLGPGDEVPAEPVAISVALADKADQLAGFFAVGEKPTGSGDPFALRRAALGIIRIVRENGLRLALHSVLEQAMAGYIDQWRGSPWLAAVPKQVAPLVRNAEVRQEMLDVAARLEAEGLAAHERILVRIMDLGQVPALREHGIAVYVVPQTGSSGELTRVFRATDAVELPTAAALGHELMDFLTDRLRVQLRAEGTRHDVVTAVLGAAADDDLNRLLRRAEAVRLFVESEAGVNLLAAHRRAVNILRIEEKRDGHAFDTGYERHLLKAHEEEALAAALEAAAQRIELDLSAEDFELAMEAMATLRAPVDAFFDKVIVNDPAPELRRNRLKLLARLRATMDAVADFSKIEA